MIYCIADYKLRKVNQLSEFYRLRLKVAIIFRPLTSEFQYAIVGIGYALLIEHSVAEAPNHLFCFAVCANFHLAYQASALIFEPAALIEIYTSLIIRNILFDFFRRRIGGQIYLVAIDFTRRKHSSYDRIAVPVNRSNERRLLLGYKFDNFRLIHN